VAESRVSSEEGGRSEGKRSAKDFGEPAWRTAGRKEEVRKPWERGARSARSRRRSIMWKPKEKVWNKKL